MPEERRQQLAGLRGDRQRVRRLNKALSGQESFFFAGRLCLFSASMVVLWSFAV